MKEKDWEEAGLSSAAAEWIKLHTAVPWWVWVGMAFVISLFMAILG